MSKDEGNCAQDGLNCPVVIDLDEIEHEPTGDPLLDRGMQMTIDEVEEALADPEHPDHDAAKAANRELAKQFSGFAESLFGDQFRRISENLTAAFRPDLGRPLSAPTKRHQRLAARQSHPPLANALEVPEDISLEGDRTPQKTLEALLDVSERMSEMVLVAAEHRDVAIAQAANLKDEADASRKSERRMLWLTWLALLGTWVAVIVALIAL